jgi:hypothetical protein
MLKMAASFVDWHIVLDQPFDRGLEKTLPADDSARYAYNCTVHTA